MAFKPAVAVFDTCILYPFHIKNVIVQTALDGLIEARWTDAIHAEWIRNLVTNMPAIPVERLHITRQHMNDALAAATVGEYQHRIDSVTLPDPGDRHVVAAGIAAGASVILSWNQRDFPASELRKHGLRRQSPHTCLADLYDTVPDLTVGSVPNARRNLSKTRVSAADFTDILKRLGLVHFRLVARVRKQLAELGVSIPSDLHMVESGQVTPCGGVPPDCAHQARLV
jgi:hypothetical protein